jgi:hypothetical protein
MSWFSDRDSSLGFRDRDVGPDGLGFSDSAFAFHDIQT